MILDEFVLLKKLGEGAFATVWAARKVDDRSRLYAVKHLKQADDPARGVNLLATPEFRSLKAIPRCPHVLRAVQVARERGQVFLVTEWCDTDLLKLVESARDRGAGGLPERVAASALRHLLLALERVHASKWTHRDVKPENILIANGVAKLADFGEATEFANEDARRTYVGTRWYRAPEQFLLADEVRRPGAADVWDAGCVLVECLLGHALFRGASDADMLRKIAETIGARGVDAETAASFARLAENGVAPRGDGRLEEIVRGQNPAASPAALDLARKLLTIDPERRITAAEALRHPFVRDAGNAPVALDAAGTPSAPGLRVGGGGGGGGGGVGGVGRATAAGSTGRGGGGAAARAPPPPAMGAKAAKRAEALASRRAALAAGSDSSDDEFEMDAAPVARSANGGGNAPSAPSRVGPGPDDDASGGFRSERAGAATVSGIPLEPTAEAAAYAAAIREAQARAAGTPATTSNAANAANTSNTSNTSSAANGSAGGLPASFGAMRVGGGGGGGGGGVGAAANAAATTAGADSSSDDEGGFSGRAPQYPPRPVGVGVGAARASRRVLGGKGSGVASYGGSGYNSDEFDDE